MAVRPMLADLELQVVDEVASDQHRVLAGHPVPGLEGDLTQELGRRATTITLSGVLAGEQVAVELKALRDKFLGAQPVPFAADIATATRVQDVLIEEMGVRELAGKTELYQYAFTLREFVPAPPPAQEPPPVIPPPVIPPQAGRLEVQVVVEGQPDFDMGTVTVTVTGRTDEGTPLNRTLTGRAGDLWTEPEFPPGRYTATATVVGPPPMQGDAAADVRPGALAHVTITLRSGAAANLARTFVVHFHFDSAFVEPCMRPVLEQVVAHAAANPDERLLIVGHTDLTGPPAYNQSLSERRARAVFAFLTAGTDPAAARAEWGELRRLRPAGTTVSLRDSWDRRVQQWILRDLGGYQANIDTESPPPENAALTEQAVRDFQSGAGLPPTGVVDDATWTALIDGYLGRNPLSVPAARFLPNARAACDGGPLKWLGSGEIDPIEDTDTAIRRNRRVELMFVRAAELPGEAGQPDTFALPAPGAVSPRWCLSPGGGSPRACFVKLRNPGKETCRTPDAQRFDRQPAEPGDVPVSGSIRFEDGTPLADTPFTLIAPDGTILTGEHRSAPLRGWPIAHRTGPDGGFAVPAAGVGVYTLEVWAPVVARRKGVPLAEARGNVVCARLDTARPVFDVVVTGRTAAAVVPTVTAPPAVIVRKAGSNPRRQPCRLGAGAFTGTGTLTRSSDAVRLFAAAVAGTELAFDGTANVFTAAQLAAGVTVFAEGARASAAVGDVELRLALTVDGQPGRIATAAMTAVDLTLDVAVSRTAPGVDPAPVPAALKANPGRFVQARLADLGHERAMLIVRPPVPAGFTGDLELAVTGPVQVFADEVPAAGQAAVVTPRAVPAPVPAAGLRFFVEGTAPSALAADASVLLGLRGVEPEGDKVALTVGQVELVDTATAAAPAVAFARVGLWDNAFDAAGTVANGAAEAANFAGADSRRFFFRLRDAARAGAGSADIEWQTVGETGDGVNTPVSTRLTLVESGAGTGVFLSRAVLLVTDNDDQNQPTHSGLPAALPDGAAAVAVRTRNQSNHRLRRADVRASVRATYPQLGVPGVRISRAAPVFRRVPEDRHRLPLQIFVLRVAPGGTGVVPTVPAGPIFTRDLRVAEETYARLGIAVETVVRPGTPAADIQQENRLITAETVRLTGPQALVLLRPPVVVDPRNQVVLHQGAAQTALTIVQGRAPVAGEVRLDLATGLLTLAAPPAPGERLVATYVSVGHRVVLITAPAGVNPLSVRFQPVDDEAVIATAHPALAATIRVFFAGSLASTNRGEAWPEINFAGRPQAAACYINGATDDAYNMAHEIAHVLTNKDGAVNTGHYAQPAAPAGNRLFTAQNLLRSGTTVAEAVNASKRLWDAADADGVNQFTSIRASRFLRAF